MQFENLTIEELYKLQERLKIEIVKRHNRQELNHFRETHSIPIAGKRVIVLKNTIGSQVSEILQYIHQCIRDYGAVEEHYVAMTPEPEKKRTGYFFAVLTTPKAAEVFVSTHIGSALRAEFLR